MSKLEYRSDDKIGNSSSNQLLREIEALGRALYLQKTSQEKTSVMLPNHQNSNQKPKDKSTEDATKNIRRSSSSSLWNWKKSLEALSHIRDRKFSCSFFLHVHSIERLPPVFNDSSLQVHFKRKKEVLTTRGSRVSNGISDFDETLINRCSVYCRRSGQQNLCIYDPKIFLVCVSVLGVSGFDIGKHWVDLTRLLPLTIEELVGDKSTGRWATSFKLSGKAEGAILNVSFGFSVMTDSVRDTRYRLSSKSRGSGSVPLLRHLNLNNSVKKPDLELSKSVRFLYQKLEEGNSVGISDMKRLEEEEDEDGNVEFTVIDQGIELELPRTDETDSVANEFLKIVGNESEDEAESPRERLLREFEAESILSGDFLFESGEDDCSEDYTTISSVFESCGEEDETFVQSLRCRRKAQVLEELETEDLMRQWGFDESSFRVLPRCSGFGSPIEVASPKPADESIHSEISN